jgi:hypothetical protein
VCLSRLKRLLAREKQKSENRENSDLAQTVFETIKKNKEKLVQERFIQLDSNTIPQLNKSLK